MGDVRSTDFARAETARTCRIAADGRRVERRHERVRRLRALEGERLDLWRPIVQVLFASADELVRRRLDREWLRWCELFSRHLRHRNGAFLESPDRLTGLSIEGIQDRLFRRLEHTGDAAAADVDVHDDRRRRRVVVPHVVMDHLIGPLALSGLDVQRDQTCGVEIVPRTEPAVHVLGGAIGRDVDDAAFRVRRQRRP